MGAAVEKPDGFLVLTEVEETTDDDGARTEKTRRVYVDAKQLAELAQVVRALSWGQPPDGF